LSFLCLDHRAPSWERAVLWRGFPWRGQHRDWQSARARGTSRSAAADVFPRRNPRRM